MTKSKRENLRFVLAASILPPAFSTKGDETTFKCVYVTPEGKQITHMCTHEVWKRCEGNNQVGKPRNGLCEKINVLFFMWVDDSKNKDATRKEEKGVVVDIDVIPENYYQRTQVRPEYMLNQETIDVQISPGGSVVVDAIPTGVNRKNIENLILGLNEVDKLAVGDRIKGGYEVQDIIGNKVKFLTPPKF